MRTQLLLTGWILVAGMGIGAVGAAQAIRPTDLAPLRWVEQVTPENLPKLNYPGFANALDKARMEIQSGRYRLALQTLQLAEGVDPVQRTLMMGDALLRAGRFAEAMETLSRPEVAANSSAKGMYALALAESGKRREAAALLQAAVAADMADPVLHWDLARVWRSMGQVSEEKNALEWFGQQGYQQTWRKDGLASIGSADTLTVIGGALDRRAVLTGEYRENHGLHQDVLNMFIRAYDEIDRRNADAHVAAARFFLAHGDSGKAKEELDHALALNPNHPEAMQVLGHESLRRQDANEVELALRAMRSVNPDYPGIRQTEAGLLMLARQRDLALQVLLQAQKADPDSAELMAALAACDALSGNPADLARRLAQADAMMPQESVAQVEAAEMILTMQPRRAIPLLEQAIAQSPHWNRPRNMLGMALMLGTDTEKARPVLEAAHDLDPFSVETTNYLRLLDTLAAFETHTSPHFAVRFSPGTDPFLGDEILNYMEGNYARICGIYQYEPGERTLIELMPENQDFSVRVSGRPWHATYAVTQGPVITIIAPRVSSKTVGPFDWADVLRHEFTHTVTLGMTDGRIPRWFTEGLTVSEQITPLWSTRYRLLARAGAQNALVPVNQLDQAIVTGTNPELGYSQGYWICRWIEEKKGHQAILGMIDSYRAGLSTDAVFQKHLGISVPDFDVQFARWAKAKLKDLGLDPMAQKALAALIKQGNDLIQQKDYRGAVEVWEKAYALCPVNLQVHQRLAGLYLYKDINEPEKAVPHLEALDHEQLKDNRYAMRLAKLYLQLGKPQEAVASARRACQIKPYDAEARKLLIQTLTQAGATDEAAKQEKIVAWLDARKPTAAPAAETQGE